MLLKFHCTAASADNAMEQFLQKWLRAEQKNVAVLERALTSTSMNIFAIN